MSELGAHLLARDGGAEVPAWARAIGVTRVARVTGLDRCGVEVACAIRPAGQLLQVSNGKGRTFAQAKASALSEALELFALENPDPARLGWRVEEPGPAYWPGELLTGEGPRRSRAVAQPWADAERLDTRGRVQIPASLVWCPGEGGAPVGLRTAAFTANGVGANVRRGPARWHALLELCEREALTRTFARGWTPRHLRERGLSFAHPLVPALEAQGMRVHLVDATPDGWPVPVVAAAIVDPGTGAPPLAAGYACRLSGTAAAEAALFEACQSRLTEIHGAREDVEQAPLEVPAWLRRGRTSPRAAEGLPRFSGSIAMLLKALGVAAAAVDVTPPGCPLSVQRVFVPGFRISGLLV